MPNLCYVKSQRSNKELRGEQAIRYSDQKSFVKKFFVNNY